MSGIPRGAIRFNTDSNKPELWDGSQWAEFQLSTPNLGRTVIGAGVDYSPGWSPSGINNPGNAFDGDLSTLSGSNGGSFGPFTYTFSPAITGVTSARMRVNLGATSSQVGSTVNVIKADGTDVTQKAKDANAFAGNGLQWIDVTTEVGDTWNTFQITGTGGSTNPSVGAVEVNGQLIISNYPNERGPGGRGVFSQGFTGSVTGRLDYINIASTGNAITFVDGTAMYAQASFSSSTRGVSAGGASPDNRNILFITFASTGTQTDSGGDLSSNLIYYGTGVSNSTRGLICGGLTPTYKSEIEYVTIASLGNSQDFGHLTADKFGMGAVSNPTRGLLMGGHLNGSITDNIDMVTIPTLGNAQDFGTLTSTTAQGSGASNATRGVLFGGRYVGTRSKIEYVTIASLGNGTDFGDLSRTTTRDGGAVASSTRGVFAGGDQDSPSSLAEVNVIDYIQISTQGDAIDFGDLTVARNHMSGMSNAHGGL